MRRIIGLCLALLAVFASALTVNAEEAPLLTAATAPDTAAGNGIEFVKDGVCEYRIVSTSNWRGIDDNLDIFSEFTEILKNCTGSEFSFNNAVSSITDKEIFLGFSKESNKHKERIAVDSAYGTYLYDSDLVGATGWQVRTFGDRIVINVVESNSSAISGDALYYFLHNALGYDPDAETAAQSDITLKAVNHIHSEYLDAEQIVGLTIDGTNIRDFRIVYGANASKTVIECAKNLRRVLFALTGFDCGLSDDTAESSEHEILVGNTNRSAAATEESVLKSEGGKLYIGGKNDMGVENALGVFYRDCLNIESKKFAGEGDIEINALNKTGKFFRAESECKNAMPYFRHNISSLLGTSETPCFSDSATVDKLISAVSAQNPTDGSTVYLINNTSKYCTCEKCQGKTEAYFAAVNEVAKKFADRNITVATLAYAETATAPSFALEKNVAVYFAAPKMCCAHAIDDASCETNAAVCASLNSWEGKADTLYVLDYTQDYNYYSSTFPNFKVMRPNIAYYCKHANGVIYVWDSKNAALEYGDLRLALLGRLISNPEISDADYAEAEKAIAAELYGSSSEEVLGYLNKFTDNAASHYNVMSKPSEILPIAKKEDGSYDLALAAELYGYWKRIYARHSAPTEDLSGMKEYYFAASYRDSSYYLPLHSRVQFSTWVRCNVDPLGIFAAMKEIVSK